MKSHNIGKKSFVVLAFVASMAQAIASQCAESPSTIKNPVRDVVCSLLHNEGVGYYVKTPSLVVSNKLDSTVSRKLNGEETTLWIGKSSYGKGVDWCAGLSSPVDGSGDVLAVYHFRNRTTKEQPLPDWARSFSSNIPPSRVIGFSQRWNMNNCTNGVPPFKIHPVKQLSAEKNIIKAIKLRHKGKNIASSKALRGALEIEPLNTWAVVERVFLEDGGEGVLEVLSKNRMDVSSHLKEISDLYLNVGCTNEVQVLIAQMKGKKEFEQACEYIQRKMKVVKE